MVDVRGLRYTLASSMIGLPQYRDAKSNYTERHVTTCNDVREVYKKTRSRGPEWRVAGVGHPPGNAFQVFSITS